MRQGRHVVAKGYILVFKHSHVISKMSHSASSECVGREQTPMRRRLNLPPSTVSVSIQPQDARGFAALAIRATVTPSTPLAMEDQRPTWMFRPRSGPDVSHTHTRLTVVRLRVQACVSRVNRVLETDLEALAYVTRLWLMVYCEEE